MQENKNSHGEEGDLSFFLWQVKHFLRQTKEGFSVKVRVAKGKVTELWLQYTKRW